MKVFPLAGLVLLLSTSIAFAQPPTDWPHLDLEADGIRGMSTQKAYQDFLAGKESQTVVVAVIDSGIDIEHEDLADIIWVNEDEIPENGIDDDGNGYVDDVHGWNFIGGPDGSHIHHENLEIIRLYNRWKDRFEGADPDKLNKSARAEYERYLEYKEEIEQKREDLAPQFMLMQRTVEAFDALIEDIDKPAGKIMVEDIRNYESGNPVTTQTAKLILTYLEQGETFEGIYESVQGDYDYFNSSYNFNWNPDFDARYIVGDDPSNLDDRNYGNNDVEGPDATHGTHVAGIIGAIRGNGIGMDGVANNVRIMSIRTVPDGDERDKDVANAIYYAVDNGAQVINMSFGKGASPYKQAVDDAVRYAVENDVVLVHAAGNDHKENDIENNFPNDYYERKGLFRPRYADTWIEVGAMTANNDAKLTASFSNWSADLVDVFAPGAAIYATVPGDEYRNLQGTSMAAPMVAGLAALLRSYFPDLTAEQVKEIIMDSAVAPSFRVNIPGEDDQALLTRLSVTGGVANTYTAVQLAMQTNGRKRRAPERDAELVRP